MKHLALRATVLVLFGSMCAGLGTLLNAGDDVVCRVAIKMVKVERTPALEEEKEIRGKRLWGDDVFDTAWNGQESGFNVTLTNRKDEELLITWEKSWLIDEEGKKREIIPPSRIAGKTKDTRTSTVPARGSLQIMVMPQDYIKDQAPDLSISGNMPMAGRSSWKFPVFKQTYTEKEVKKITKKQEKVFKKKYGDYSDKKFDFNTFIEEKTIEVVLNMDINGTSYMYHFYFNPYVLN
jgi:hypothetical protein